MKRLFISLLAFGGVDGFFLPFGGGDIAHEADAEHLERHGEQCSQCNESDYDGCLCCKR